VIPPGEPLALGVHPALEVGGIGKKEPVEKWSTV